MLDTDSSDSHCSTEPTTGSPSKEDTASHRLRHPKQQYDQSSAFFDNSQTFSVFSHPSVVTQTTSTLYPRAIVALGSRRGLSPAVGPNVVVGPNPTPMMFNSSPVPQAALPTFSLGYPGGPICPPIHRPILREPGRPVGGLSDFTTDLTGLMAPESHDMQVGTRDDKHGEDVGYQETSDSTLRFRHGDLDFLLYFKATCKPLITGKCRH